MYKTDNTQPLTVMGLMSGTSVDSVDACLTRLEYANGRLLHEFIATYTHDIPEELRTRLLACMREKQIHLEELCRLNVAVGELFAEAANGLLQENNLKPQSVDCLGSHGQTIYHWPPSEAGKLGGTLQIGEPSIIAEKTGIVTIADFRPRDMAAGGHGAPLVCFADQLLFQDETIGRCVQNIGGIANVTVVPSRDAFTKQEQPVIAFDTGPGNMLMDAAMRHFYNQSYDENGVIARSGTVQVTLLNALMQHSYLTQSPPKTTGRELFGEQYLEALLRNHPDLSPPDWLATLTRFTAASIADAYERFVFPRYEIGEVIVGGGGSFNAFLLEMLRAELAARGSAAVVKTHADYGIPDKYKEALAFAILAWATLLHRPNNIPSCTGAAHPVILGKQVF